MITIRRSYTFGTAHSDTLTLRCQFAFADYQNPACQHEGRLRAVNLGMIAPHATYHLGPEANVDILTWVKSGTLSAQIDEFPKETVNVSGLHLISTGKGCAALDWTAGDTGAAFIQFWLLADTEGVMPAQETRAAFPLMEDGGFRIIASGFPEDDPEEMESITDGSPVTLTARARLLHAAIPTGEGAAYRTTPGRDLYLLVVSGSVSIGSDTLLTGDAATFSDVEELVVIAGEAAVVLLVDIAA